MLIDILRPSRIGHTLGVMVLMTGAVVAICATSSISVAAASARPSVVKGHFGGTRFAPAAIADCPANWACGFAKKDYNGGFGKWQGANSNFNSFTSNGACFYNSDGSGTAGPFNNGSWNDCISSTVNNLAGTATIYWFPNSSCVGDNLAQGNGATFQNLANRTQSNGNSWDDVISADNINSNGSC